MSKSKKTDSKPQKEQQHKEENVYDEDSLELEQLNLTIVAGTYHSNLLGWNYLLETRLDFDHIVNAFMSSIPQEKTKESNHDEDKSSEQTEEDSDKANDEDSDKDERDSNEEEGEDKNSEEEGEEEEDNDEIDKMIDEDLKEDGEDIQTSNDGTIQVLTPFFAIKPHTGSINCVTSNGKYMASGGFDENIVIYNLNTKKDSGVIHYTQGSITCLALVDHFLFVGSSTGMLTVYYQEAAWPKVWEIEAHAKNAIRSLSVHPTGRLVLTLGDTDHRLRLWNMLNGTLLQTVSLGLKTYLDVQWSPNGDSFAVLQRNSVEIYSTEKCELLAVVPQFDKQEQEKSKPVFTCFKYLSEQLIATGTTDGNIQVYNIHTKTAREISNVHKNRIKALDCEAVNVGEFALVSVCSGGVLSVHRVSDEFIFQEASKEMGVRFTCVTFDHHPSVKQFVESRYQEFENFLDDAE
jgi:WD40 repeat protein